jgi:hypothetical protein
MRIFLKWARDSVAGARLDPGVVARSLQEVVAPLFAAAPHATVEGNAAAAPVEAVLVALAAESRAGTNLASPHHGP